jgi:hypothetical protein
VVSERRNVAAPPTRQGLDGGADDQLPLESEPITDS